MGCFVQALEALAQPAGGRFSEPQVRSDFIAMIDGYRVLLGKLQAGANIERNIIGARNEIVAIVAALEEGTVVFSIGPVAKVKINPGLFDLPRSYTLGNAPAEVPVQIDVGTQTVDGRLVVSEVTTGELSLPEFLKGLDPQSGEPAGGKIDYAKFNKSDASHRKFLQMIHIRAAAKFATELAKAFSGLSGSKAQVQAPDMVIKVGKASAPAKRVAKELGFNVIETGK